jgi:uncharacterized protein YeaO (DUF488 family)
MPIKTKRWDDKRNDDDGFRLLICRHKPRVLAKKKEPWNNWYPELGPSKELHTAFYGKTGTHILWEEFRRRYLEEIQEQSYIIRDMAALVGEGKTITLLCSSGCTDASHCHRSLLKELVEAEVARLPAVAKAESAPPVA